MPQTDTLAALHEATRRAVRTVDGLTDQDLVARSLLPGWSRAHVVAHLALNAEGLARVLAEAGPGRVVPLYPSSDRRDADIEALAAAPARVLRDRFLASCTYFWEAAGHRDGDGWQGGFSRVPGGPEFPVAAVPPMRHREVEVHHADLGAGYSAADWPQRFLLTTLEEVLTDRAEGPGMRLRSPEGDLLVAGGAGPVVSGSRADLTWWLLGRGDGSGLSGDPAVPTLGPWR